LDVTVLLPCTRADVSLGREIRSLRVPASLRITLQSDSLETSFQTQLGMQKEEDVDATHSREKRTYTHLQTHAHTSTYLGDGHGHRQGVFWRTAHAVARQSSRLCGGFMYRRCSF
jgi:hypothetical protein